VGKISVVLDLVAQMIRRFVVQVMNPVALIQSKEEYAVLKSHPIAADPME